MSEDVALAAGFVVGSEIGHDNGKETGKETAPRRMRKERIANFRSKWGVPVPGGLRVAAQELVGEGP